MNKVNKDKLNLFEEYDHADLSKVMPLAEFMNLMEKKCMEIARLCQENGAAAVIGLRRTDGQEAIAMQVGHPKQIHWLLHASQSQFNETVDKQHKMAKPQGGMQ